MTTTKSWLTVCAPKIKPDYCKFCRDLVESEFKKDVNQSEATASILLQALENETVKNLNKNNNQKNGKASNKIKLYTYIYTGCFTCRNHRKPHVDSLKYTLFYICRLP